MNWIEIQEAFPDSDLSLVSCGNRQRECISAPRGTLPHNYFKSFLFYQRALETAPFQSSTKVLFSQLIIAEG